MPDVGGDKHSPSRGSLVYCVPLFGLCGEDSDRCFVN
jgi:hypothetical protein